MGTGESGDAVIVYAVFEVTDFQSAVEIKTLIALRTTRMAADEVVSHQPRNPGYVDYEVEEWEVLE